MSKSWVSSQLGTSNQYVKYQITVVENSVDAINNRSSVTVSVKFKRTNTGYETYGTGTVYCKINGTQYTQAVTPSQKITNSGIVLFSKTLYIAHNSDGTKTLNVQAKISLGSVLSSDYQGMNCTLTAISVVPTAPTSFKAYTDDNDGYVSIGEIVKLAWSGATGNVTAYQIEYTRGDSAWHTVGTFGGEFTSITFKEATVEYDYIGSPVKFRIRAMNGNTFSNWKVSNTLYISSGVNIKVNNAWKVGTPWIKVNGSWKRAKRVWIKVNGEWKYAK